VFQASKKITNKKLKFKTILDKKFRQFKKNYLIIMNRKHFLLKITSSISYPYFDEDSFV
jgi:hypothetical protein